MMLTTLAIVVTHFWALIYIKKFFKKEKIQKKLKKMVKENKNIYISENNIPEHPENHQRLVEKNQNIQN